MPAKRKLLILAVAVALALVPASPQSIRATSLTVNTLADTDDGICDLSPDCTLREALNAANANGATPDTITFSVSGTISPTSPLPELSAGGTTIAGSDQAITIYGSGLPEGSDCLTVSSDGNAVQGLAIARCPVRGIIVTGANNTIGGTTASKRNVVGFNSGGGIHILGTEAIANVVIGNYIGIDPEGNSAWWNGDTGVVIAWGASYNTVGGPTPDERNVIGASKLAGVAVVGEGATGNLVEGNYIGVNVGGTSALGNLVGVAIVDGADATTVRDNVVSGNNSGGMQVGGNVYVLAGAPPGQEWNPIQPLDPIWSDDSVIEVRIGGGVVAVQKAPSGWMDPILIAVTGQGNDMEVIVEPNPPDQCGEVGPLYLVHRGTAEWVQLTKGTSNDCNGDRVLRWFGFIDIPVAPYGPASGNIIQGNFIGTDPGQAICIPNRWGGISMFGGGATSGTVVGGPNPGEGNVIACNGTNGIEFWPPAAGTTIRGNSIHSNKRKGIENHGALPEPPQISALAPVTGTACAFCTIDVYSDSAGEGRYYHGSTDADGAGVWVFSDPVGGPAVTATATDAAGNTSEFSAPFKDSGDTDGDTVPNSSDPDDDNDGCTDQQELGFDEELGGARDPHFFWDFFDANRDGSVSGLDFFGVLGRFNATQDPPLSKEDALVQAMQPPPPPPAYHASHDRTSPAPGTNPWDTGPPDSAISGLDFFAVLAQFNHQCS